MSYRQVTINTARPAQAQARVMLLYTGGTFGMTYDREGVLIPFDFASIEEHLPTLRTLALDLTVISFEHPIDSSNMKPTHWQTIAGILWENRENFDGFVVLHGTDTMAFTASALSFMLPGFGKPIIFTGAQLPIREPRSDARENLITALEIAAARYRGNPRIQEVCIYFGNTLLRGNRARKVESQHFDAFESGNYPALARAGVQIAYHEAALLSPSGPPGLRMQFDPRLAVIKLFPGMSWSVAEATLRANGLQACILETYGSGNAPTDRDFIQLLRNATDRGIILLNISQCPGGTVQQGKYETSKHLRDLGVISGADMTLEAAVAKTMLALASDGPEATRHELTQSWAGEISALPASW